MFGKLCHGKITLHSVASALTDSAGFVGIAKEILQCGCEVFGGGGFAFSEIKKHAAAGGLNDLWKGRRSRLHDWHTRRHRLNYIKTERLAVSRWSAENIETSEEYRLLLARDIRQPFD